MKKITTRYLEEAINSVCFTLGRMAFVSGPRQCGKTTMAKHLLRMRDFGHYYNWDETTFRRLWSKDPRAITQNLSPKKSQKPLLILDEIHKAKLWKKSLKGVYDTSDNKYDIIVTGSTRLNVYRKGSDSLLGRYHHFRLHPFSLAEITSTGVSHESLLEVLFSNKVKEKKSQQ